MALVTGVIECLTYKLQLCGFPVGAVASAAIHLSFEERMRKCLQCLRALQLMTVVANLGLCRGLQNSISRCMTNVAICTRNFIVVMWAAVPPKTNISAVTIEAHSILHHDIRVFLRSKFDDRRPFLPTSHSWGVLAARPVTRLALQLAMAERAARISWHGVFGLEHAQGFSIVVAGDTGIGSFPAVRYVRRCLAS
jgi:hypothetical protein